MSHFICVFQFNAITSAVYKFADETPDRSPFTDWSVEIVMIVMYGIYNDILLVLRYAVDTGHRRGFTARPVIGGLYARLLTSGNSNN